MRTSHAAVLVAFLSALPACTGDESIDDPSAQGSGNDNGDGTTPYQPENVVANLEIHALDIWGRPLAAEIAKLDITTGAERVATDGFPQVVVPLADRRDFKLHLAAQDFQPLDLTVTFDGTTGAHAVTVSGATPGHGVAIANTSEGGAPKHVLFLGLRHKWFSAQGRPPRSGNAIELFHSGEAGWQSVRGALDAATKSVLIATWWWDSQFELTRDPNAHPYLSASERWHNTIMGVLEHSKAYKRVLVNQILSQDGILSSLTTDSYLRDHGKKSGDDFEFMGQSNPTHGAFFFQPRAVDFAARVHVAEPSSNAMDFEPAEAVPSNLPARQVDLTEWPVDVDIDAASYHQKFLVVDDGLAFVGGMNFRPVDWDSDKHEVFNYRRENYGASTSARLAVKNKEALPDNGPRKDYLMRIDGPAAQDVADVFQERWQHQLADKVEYSQNASPFSVGRDIPEHQGGTTVQITATLPEPFYENAIGETWFNAVDNAERYIFIEDQYFRAPMLNERIKARMLEKPDLLLIVVTKSVSEWTDPGCAWTYQSHQLFATQFPGRYLPLQLRSFDTSLRTGVFVIDETKGNFADFDTHAKMLLVDDVFMSVGSANKNNRAMIYEAEMTATVVDPAFVTSERRRTIGEILGKSPSEDPAAWFAELAAAAKANDVVYAAWKKEGGDLNLNGAPLPAAFQPHGFVYSLPFGTLKDCLLESIGPDMTKSNEAPRD